MATVRREAAQPWSVIFAASSAAGTKPWYSVAATSTSGRTPSCPTRNRLPYVAAASPHVSGNENLDGGGGSPLKRTVPFRVPLGPAYGASPFGLTTLATS